MTLVRLQDRPDEQLKSEVYDLLVQNPPPTKVQSANNSLLETSLKGSLSAFTFDCMLFVAVNVNVCIFSEKSLLIESPPKAPKVKVSKTVSRKNKFNSLYRCCLTMYCFYADP